MTIFGSEVGFRWAVLATWLVVSPSAEATQATQPDGGGRERSFLEDARVLLEAFPPASAVKFPEGDGDALDRDLRRIGAVGLLHEIIKEHLILPAEAKASNRYEAIPAELQTLFDARFQDYREVRASLHQDARSRHQGQDWRSRPDYSSLSHSVLAYDPNADFRNAVLDANFAPEHAELLRARINAWADERGWASEAGDDESRNSEGTDSVASQPLWLLVPMVVCILGIVVLSTVVIRRGRVFQHHGLAAREGETVRLCGAPHSLHMATGEVLDASKHTSTEVWGGGGGSSGDGHVHVNPIRSESTTHDTFFLRTRDGRENAFQLTDFDVALRRGNVASVIWMIRKGRERGPYFLVRNHFTGEEYWGERILEALLAPSLWWQGGLLVLLMGASAAMNHASDATLPDWTLGAGAIAIGAGLIWTLLFRRIITALRRRAFLRSPLLQVIRERSDAEAAQAT